METGSTRICVVPRGGGGWDLRETAVGPVLGRAGAKRDAIVQATVMLERGRGGQVVVIGADGAVQRTLAVDPAPPRPWWYLRAGVLRWLAPLLFGFQGVLRLLDWRPGILPLVLTVLLLAWSVGILVLALLSRSLDRGRGPVDDLH